MLRYAGVPHASTYRWLLFVDPDFQRLVQDLDRELGADLPEAAQTLYGELDSPAYRCALLLILGGGRSRGSVGLLNRASASEDHRVACAASYALGLSGNEEARRLLMDRYRSLVRNPDDHKPGELKAAVEAGLAASGEKAVPFLLEQARLANAALDAREGPPEPGERYYVGEACLASLRIDHLSPELKELFLTESDPRIRSSLLVGLARNPSLEVYGFLAEAAEAEPSRRLDVLQAVGRVISGEMAGPLPSSLADPLRRIFRSGDPQSLQGMDLQSWIALGCQLGGADDLARLRPLFKMDLAKLGGESGPDVRDSLAFSLGRIKDGGKALSEFLEALPEGEDRSGVLAAALRHEESGVPLGPDEIRTLLGGIEKQDPGSIDVCPLLWPLARARVDQEAILGTFERVYADGTATIRATVLDTAGKMGSPSIPFLETVLHRENDPLLRAEAARQLVTLTAGKDSPGRLAPEIAELLIPGKPLGAEVFNERSRRRWAYCELVREYYSRVGTPEDLKTLGSIPDRISFDSSVDPEDARVYRSYLREQCRQARDAILLRDSRD
jgi:hypothetical protein